MQEINDELMMPCPQCCRKHLSAAIAHYADLRGPVFADGIGDEIWRVLLARALINLAESDQGYESHRLFATGLLVRAEVACADRQRRTGLRSFRLAVVAGEYPPVPVSLLPNGYECYLAHVTEAEREYPDIRAAVEREPFYRDNMSEPELRQAEVNYRLAQLRWLDENVFGLKAVEKGEEEMACAKKAACKGGAVKKAGKVKMTKLVKGNKKGK